VQIQHAQLRRLLGARILRDALGALAADLEGGARVGEKFGARVAREGVDVVEGELGAVALGGARGEADGGARGGGRAAGYLEAVFPEGTEGYGAGG
jgi:hypothetical protein